MKLAKAFSLAWVLSFPLLASANDNVIVVIDASNSMWGQIHGISKIELARQSMADLLENHSAENIGLVVYGNQRKGDCDAIVTKARPGEADVNSLLETISKISPSGRSPMSAALRQAAELGDTILLISDGQESCDDDPCVVTKELKETHPNLRIDVVGFTEKQSEQLQCIAENTGGSSGPISGIPPLSSKQGKSKHPQESHNNQPAGVLQLSLGASNNNENLPASFIIYDTHGKHITTLTAQNDVAQSLEAGNYHIDAIWGETKVSRTLEVKPGETTVYRFNIGALGEFTLDAVNAQNTPIPANFTVYDEDGDYVTNYLLKSHVNDALPEGDYQIKASIEGETQEQELTLSKDAPIGHNFIFKTSP